MGLRMQAHRVRSFRTRRATCSPGLAEHLQRLSAHGDPLVVLERTVDFEHFRGWLVEGLGYGDGARGGRPPFDPVSMFKALILQAQHNLSDARMEFMIRDRLSWMRFLGFDLGAPARAL